MDAAASFVAAFRSTFPHPDPEGPGAPRERVQHIDVREG
jgi:hypothetical protein